MAKSNRNVFEVDEELLGGRAEGADFLFNEVQGLNYTDMVVPPFKYL